MCASAQQDLEEQSRLIAASSRPNPTAADGQFLVLSNSPSEDSDAGEEGRKKGESEAWCCLYSFLLQSVILVTVTVMPPCERASGRKTHLGWPEPVASEVSGREGNEHFGGHTELCIMFSIFVVLYINLFNDVCVCKNIQIIPFTFVIWTAVLHAMAYRFFKQIFVLLSLRLHFCKDRYYIDRLTLLIILSCLSYSLIHSNECQPLIFPPKYILLLKSQFNHNLIQTCQRDCQYIAETIWWSNHYYSC